MVSQPKTHNSIRVLPVSQQAVDLMIEEHKKRPGSPYMFPSPKTGGMFDPDSFWHTHVIKSLRLSALNTVASMTPYIPSQPYL